MTERTLSVILQPWTEYERGWGSRPDGYSIHLTMADRDLFVDAFNKEFNSKDKVPDEYSIAEGSPRTVHVSERMRAVMNLEHFEHIDAWRKHGTFISNRDARDLESLGMFKTMVGP